MMEEARENKGEASYNDIDEYIEGAEKFVELFVKIDEKRVWNGLAPYLPTQPGPEHAIIFNGVKFEMRKHSDAIFGKWFNFLYEASDPENEE
uniref:Uncharacterized protein n=1 Tax=Meloidogyne enterolobii TaxID=390850 RepID=A0A6V7X074_MELEN|nr:unnamed protein product [Meloidogyne enterolobii]